MDYIKQYLKLYPSYRFSQAPRSDSPDPILSLNILTSIEQLKNDYRCGR